MISPHPKANPRLLAVEPVQRCGFPACGAACCVHGAWIDPVQMQDILRNALLIQPHLLPEYRDPTAWFDDQEEADPFTLTGTARHTTVVEDPAHYGGMTCIFMCKDYKCALQAAADANGLHPWQFKPFYCILHPLDLDEHGRITLDETGLMVDEPASCLRRSAKPRLLVELFAEELEYFLGEQGYQRILSGQDKYQLDRAP